MQKRRTFIAAALVALVALGLGACQWQSERRDLEGVEGLEPDAVELYRNVNDHPSVVRMCIDGVAFRTVSPKHQNGFTSSIDRVPEWDSWCEVATENSSFSEGS